MQSMNQSSNSTSNFYNSPDTSYSCTNSSYNWPSNSTGYYSNDSASFSYSNKSIDSNDGSFTSYNQNNYSNYDQNWSNYSNYYPYQYTEYNYIPQSNYENQEYQYNYNYNYNYSQSTSTSPLKINEIEQQVQSSPIESDNQNNKVNKKTRANRKQLLSEEAVNLMNEWFEDHFNNPYPQPEEKERLACQGGITVKQVTAWFSNRRNRSQNTKPKRMRRVMEKEMNNIFDRIVSEQPDKHQMIEQFKSTIVSSNF